MSSSHRVSPLTRETWKDGSIGEGPTLDLSAFGGSLFSAVTSDRDNQVGNVLISPLSVARSLALTAAGVTRGGVAEREIFRVLGVRDHSEVPRLMDEVFPGGAGWEWTPWKMWQRWQSGVILTAANSIWAREMKEGFVNTAKSVHGAKVGELPKTYRPINTWIERETGRMIGSMFDPDQEIDPLTEAILVDTVLFKGSWTDKFDKSRTKTGMFRAIVGISKGTESYLYKEREANFMTKDGKVPVNNHGRTTIVRLDYGSREFCALFVLPFDSSVGAMDRAVNGLVTADFKKVLEDLQAHEIMLSIPRFQINWGPSSLVPALRALGVNAPFNTLGSFKPISDMPDFHMNSVVHRATMEVTEGGTVAAAATVSGFDRYSMPSEITFDRPFLMVILHVATGTPIFLSRINAPELL